MVELYYLTNKAFMDNACIQCWTVSSKGDNGDGAFSHLGDSKHMVDELNLNEMIHH